MNLSTYSLCVFLLCVGVSIAGTPCYVTDGTEFSAALNEPTCVTVTLADGVFNASNGPYTVSHSVNIVAATPHNAIIDCYYADVSALYSYQYNVNLTGLIFQHCNYTAISFQSGTFRVDNCIFRNNSYTHLTGAGGAGALSLSQGEMVVTDSFFFNNGLVGSNCAGGGISAGHANLTLINTLFKGNMASSGGALNFNQGILKLINTTMTEGHCRQQCGGMSAVSDTTGKLYMYNSRIINNVADSFTGGVYIYGMNSYIANSSIANNKSPNGDPDDIMLYAGNYNSLVLDTHGFCNISGWVNELDCYCTDGYIMGANYTCIAPPTVAPTVAPTAAPTTVAPTTVAPTTVAPTTVAPTTVVPTTVAPVTTEPGTTEPGTTEPATAAPTTKAPTTAAPTTKAPTTAAPTTNAATTKAPTTGTPTIRATATAPPDHKPVVSRVDELSFNKGETHLEVHGKYFVDPSYFVTRSVHIGPFPCKITKVVSDGKLQCTVVGGHGANQPVVVVVAGRTSLAENHIPSVVYDFRDHASKEVGCVPPAGAQDVRDPQMCNCWSGYAPADPFTNSECSVAARCPGELTADSDIAVTPLRPTVKFVDDKLVIQQVHKIGASRRDTIIDFAAPEIEKNRSEQRPEVRYGQSTCSYPGPIWVKSVSDLDCLDVFTATLPWSTHGMCGFEQDESEESPTTVVYKASIVTTYRQVLKSKLGVKGTHTRLSQTTYQISVSFVKQVKAITGMITATMADYSDPASVSVVIEDDAMYDVVSHRTMVVFETTMVWPYMINETAPLVAVWTPYGDQATDGFSAVATASGEDTCDTTQESECVQEFVMEIDSGSICDIAGKLTFDTANLLCRDAPEIGCPASVGSTSFDIKLAHTDLCDGNAGVVEADARNVYALSTFYDDAFSVPQNAFEVGDTIYFMVEVSNDDVTIDRVAINSVSLKLLDDTSAQTSVYEKETDTSVSGFEIVQQPEGMIERGKSAQVGFRFELSRSELSVLHTLSPESDAAIETVVVIDIFYHGNQKRSLTLSDLPQAQMSENTHIIVTYSGAGDEKMEMEGNKNTLNAEEGQEVGSMWWSSAPSLLSSSSCVLILVVFALFF